MLMPDSFPACRKLPRLLLVFGLASAASVQAGDILRGGGTFSPNRASTSGGTNTAATSQARANAKDTLARSTQAVQSVNSMQAAARAAAAKLAKGTSMGADPNHPGQMLPVVPNGLTPGGLEVDPRVVTDPTLWQGANAPAASTAGDRALVTIKQTNQQALLNWKTFNVGEKTTVSFDQSAGGTNKGQWIAFNKVNDPTGVPSQILGRIEAPGQVYVVNQNGIIFGGTSQVNVHTLVASSLPLNDNLVGRGLLNNPDAQFLFTALPQAAGTKGTPAFTPPPANTPNGRPGDVTVMPGAQLSSPTTADHVGGRIALIGANVTNAGTISTPDGQTILAAGLQVGFAAHDSSKASLRGLDVFVGAVDDPAAVGLRYAGKTVNSGIIYVPRGNATLAGSDVNHLGAIESSTSVSLNGRVDLKASYNAVSNTQYDPVKSPDLAPFLFKSTGSVTLGAGSTMRILPEWSATEKTVGSELALRSEINIEGKTIHLGKDAMVLAPNAKVAVDAGTWDFTEAGGLPASAFTHSGGQIYLDKGAEINVAGSTDVAVPLSQNILSLQFRGAELADSPLQRTGKLRGPTVLVDLRKSGIYNGRKWIGTPLADVTGYANIIERSVGELTTAGGTVSLNAGGSVVLQGGSKVDVSGGWVNYEAGMVKTTRLWSNGLLVDISQATPDRVYDGIFTGQFTEAHPKWFADKTWDNPLAPTGEHWEDSYFHGQAGGSLALTAPSMALDGDLTGLTITGSHQRSELPKLSSLAITFQAQEPTGVNHFAISPTPPKVVFQSGVTQKAADHFAVAANGDPLALRSDRVEKVVLSPEKLQEGGFGSLSVNNVDGSIILAAGETLEAPAGGGITLGAANMEIRGRLVAPGGLVALDVYNFSPYALKKLDAAAERQTPPADPTRGMLTIAPGAVVSAAGQISDDRPGWFEWENAPAVINGGSVSINAYSANLAAGSLIDVSGGVSVGPTGRRTYGNGGSLSIKVGQDPGLKSILGGKLNLGSALRGYSGARAGSLALLAPMIQIGGSSRDPNALLLSPDFFSEGGFGKFSLTGLGMAGSGDEEYKPGVLVAPGTKINAVAKSVVARPYSTGDSEIVLDPVVAPAGVRTPVSISLSAPGVRDQFNNQLLVRGDLILGARSEIRTDPLGSVSLSGDTAAILGSVYAPGGSISISGGRSWAAVNTVQPPRSTVYIGSKTVLSTAGTTLLTPDYNGWRTGTVLPGGMISVTGNIVAERGARLDVSGASGVLDRATGYGTVDRRNDETWLGAARDPIRMDSNGGTITLTGGQFLFSDATLTGRAGGPTALGGSLVISSGRFTPPGSFLEPTEVTLEVKQSGAVLPVSFAGLERGSIGQQVLPGSPVDEWAFGHFAVDTFNRGGFGALNLKGTVKFSGPVNIEAARSLSVADGGVIFGDSAISLKAPYVAIGKAFLTPQTPEQKAGGALFIADGQPFYFAPTWGQGSLEVVAKVIDIGSLSLQGIGRASFNAENDIRGSGALSVAGDIFLKAGQIYPPTALTFTISARDYTDGTGTAQSGSVNIAGNGSRDLPLSGGGTLNIYGSIINQGGVLRAPLGTINLGWDGSGTAPKDPVTGQAVAVTKEIHLLPGSVTSVSAVDPVSGKALIIPYGVVLDGTSWIDPAGVDITASGPPLKAVNLSAGNVDTQAGSLIDLTGGGELFAYRWVKGVGGSQDVLASSGSFAILPGFTGGIAPWAPFNPTPGNTNLGGDPGYVNSGLNVGDTIHLGSTKGLAAGDYTLLPARYALLDGAFLVTQQSGQPVGVRKLPDGSSLVSGYRYNAFDNVRDGDLLTARYEAAPGSVVRQRSQYGEFFADAFLKASAASRGVSVPRLPSDAGQLVLSATQSMNIAGSVAAKVGAGARGALIDISSPVDILIGRAGSTAAPGVLVLDSAQLSGFSAESLLIGGVRKLSADGATVAVKTGNLTVDNAGAPLSGPDIILVASKTLTLAANAELSQTGTLADGATPLTIGDKATPGSGDGALVRVSSDPAATINRAGRTSSTEPQLNVGAGVQLTGNSVILDSTSGTTLSPAAKLNAGAVSLNSGRISLELAGAGTLPSDAGLVLAGDALSSLQQAKSLSLLSYSTVDIYGTGQVGTTSLANLAIHAGEIRGFNTGGGTVSFTAQDILLDNSAGASAGTTAGATSGKLEFNAGTLHIGTNKVKVVNYAGLDLNATGGVLGEGAGGLATDGAMTVTTPRLAAAAGAVQSLTSGGALTLRAPAGGTATVASGLGAAYTLTGASILAATDISLPSGQATLVATTGDLEVTGRIDAGGTAQKFNDLTKYTDGGQVSLTSKLGSVRLGAGGLVSVAAQAGGGNAGSLSVSAPKATFLLDGSMLGQGGTGGRSGTFSLDVGSLASTGGLNAVLNAAGFNQSRAFRARTGNVLVDGTATSRTFNLSADAGAINVTGTINASGATGGTINLAANGGLTLASGAVLDASGLDFNTAGKGGAISLETRGAGGGEVKLQAGSTINLGVAAATVDSAANGKFTGTLYLRAPQNTGATDLQIGSLDGAINAASKIVAEGFKIYTPAGGLIDSVQGAIQANGQAFAGNTGIITPRLLGGQAALGSLLNVVPGAEVVNAGGATTPLSIQLRTAGSSRIEVPGAQGITFPSGTAGNNKITPSVAGTLTLPDGTSTPLTAGVAVSIPAGGVVTLGSVGTLTFASGGTGGAIAAILPAGAAYTGAGSLSVATGSVAETIFLSTTATVSATATPTTTALNQSSRIDIPAGQTLRFPSGTPGDAQIRTTTAATLRLADGSTRAIAANTDTAVPAGSSITMAAAGGVIYSRGANGGAIPVIAAAGGTYTTTNGTGLSTNRSDLILGTYNSTEKSDWNLSTWRFGPNNVPGVLTLRAAGNLVFNNALSDGFSPNPLNATGTLYTHILSTPNLLLGANAQSWSYRLTAGADLSAADVRQVTPLADLAFGAGSLQLGKTGVKANGTDTSLTRDFVLDRFQVIRTGSGDIDVSAGRNVQLLNQFASIYTAGTAVQNPSALSTGTFELPRQKASNPVDPLGAIQQSIPYPAQYSLAGGNVSIVAGGDIVHQTKGGNDFVDDAQKEMPYNWLYRRGFVDPATGEFGTSRYGDVASTSWWVDFSNFFEGVGALGGGNVSMTAGGDVRNVDAVVPTNARMPVGKPDASKLVEFGGGDLVVRAGRDIDGGTYYVERGAGLLDAGRNIKTSANRSPSLGTLASGAADYTSEDSWLPTTLFVGKGGFDVAARGDVLLGPVANVFFMPQGVNNTYPYKTYFSTYSQSSYVGASSLSGAVTLKQATAQVNGTGSGVDGGNGTPLLSLWLERVSLLTTSPKSVSYFYPWLRLAESSVTPFSTVVGIMPGTLKATAFSGDVNVLGTLNLSPSSTGTVDLLSAGSLNGLGVLGSASINGTTYRSWGTGKINLSDADPLSIPGYASPLAYQATAGTGTTTRVTGKTFLEPVDALFAESGSLQGAQAVLQTKQALHAPGVLHKADTNPIHLYAKNGDISGLSLFSGKAARVLAGGDITDIGFYIQNTRPGDLTVVAAGRDIVAYNANSPSRIQAASPGNLLAAGSLPLSGDIQLAGQGTLEVLAGRNLDLGGGPVNSDGTGLGITTIGGARNPYLPTTGADLIAAAGLGPVTSLTDSDLAIDSFLTTTLAGTDGARYIADLTAIRAKLSNGSSTATALSGTTLPTTLTDQEKAELALELFFVVLRDSGRDHALAGSPGFGNYAAGIAAVSALFPGTKWKGDLTLTNREIKTAAGGDLTLLAPGGKVTVGAEASGNQSPDQGVLTEAGGNINIFSKDSVAIGTSRIFTLRGGDEVIWSSDGDIAAGISSKTVASAPPTRVLIDPQSADVKTDLAGLSTGGGIGVLATVAGLAPGDVDLIAPSGVIDAGDAGIRSAGNLNIAAVQVVNASNIAAGGATVGAPAAPAAPAAAPSAAPPPTQPSGGGGEKEAAKNAAQTAATTTKTDEAPSLITVEVLGYGGGELSPGSSAAPAPAPPTTPAPTLDPDDEELRKKKLKEQMEQQKTN